MTATRILAATTLGTALVLGAGYATAIYALHLYAEIDT